MRFELCPPTHFVWAGETFPSEPTYMSIGYRAKPRVSKFGYFLSSWGRGWGVWSGPEMLDIEFYQVF